MTTYREKSKYRDMSADEIIADLKKRYSDDAKALEEIARAEKNIAYIKRRKNYSGQTPWQCAVSLADSLDYWF